MHLSFDVETYPRLKDNAKFVAEQTKVWTQVLDLLRSASVRTTCFVTGEFAVRHPDLVTKMVDDGHEIGSHTMTHATPREVGDAAFAEEIQESRGVLQDATGQAIDGFRCPHGQAPRTLARMLHQAGYRYDSSVANTVIPGHFDGRGAPTDPYRASLDDIRRADAHSPIWEIPLSVVPRLRIPIGGIFLTVLHPAARMFPRLLPQNGIAYLHPHDFITLQRYRGILPWSYLKWPGSHRGFLKRTLQHGRGQDMRLAQRIPIEAPDSPATTMQSPPKHLEEPLRP